MSKSKIAAIALAAAGLVACNSQGASGPQAAGQPAVKKTGEVIATVGNDVITVDDFKVKMDEQSPFIRARYNTIERKQEFLDNMVRFEVLAQEAARRGLDKDPDVLATMKKVMVQKLMRAEFEEAEGAQQLPDAELKAYYDEHLSDYVKPERVRVSHIFLASPKGDAGRSKVKSEAAKLLAEVKGKEAGTDRQAFAEAAKTRSDDAATKQAGGDLAFKTQEELTQAWGEEFAKAVVGLKTIGEVGSLVETDKGIHVVKLTGRQNALDRPFESVKSQIQSRLFREKRTKSFEDFVAKLKTDANVKVNEDVLAKIEVAGDAPAPAMAGPAPVRVPAEAQPATQKITAPNGKSIEIPAGMRGAPVKLNLQPQQKPASGN